MFTLARSVLRHKVGVVAVIAFAFFVFSDDNSEDEAKSSNPWSESAPVQASAADASDDGSMTAKIGEVANVAGEYAAEKFLGDKDLNPVELGSSAVGNFESANDAMTAANNN